VWCWQLQTVLWNDLVQLLLVWLAHLQVNFNVMRSINSRFTYILKLICLSCTYGLLTRKQNRAAVSKICVNVCRGRINRSVNFQSKGSGKRSWDVKTLQKMKHISHKIMLNYGRRKIDTMTSAGQAPGGSGVDCKLSMFTFVRPKLLSTPVTSEGDLSVCLCLPTCDSSSWRYVIFLLSVDGT